MSILRPSVLFACLILPLAGHAQTIVHQWRMGEDDPAAVAGNGVNATQNAATGAHPAHEGTGLTYSNNTPGAFSTLSVAFSGTGNYEAPAALGLTTDFAIETWVNLANTTAPQWIALLGNGSNNGYGLFVTNGLIGVARSGIGLFASTTATANTWNHVALVVQSDTNTVSFFLNGTQIGSPAGLNSFVTGFSVGGDENGAGRISAGALVDELRIFTFGQGTFTPTMLSAVPEPGTYAALAGIGVLAVALVRRRVGPRSRNT